MEFETCHFLRRSWYNKHMKTKILQILMTHQNEYISGEWIAQKLNVSRVSISKHMKTLRKEGYEILSSTNKGYCLSDCNDILNADLIQRQVDPFYHTISVVPSTTSTNDDLKAIANMQKEGYVLIADMQKKGRGRNGRSFYCESHKGIYLSLLLKPSFPLSYSLRLTACAAISAIEAIQKEYDQKATIKWVNDILMEEKKVAGILCEASLEINSAALDYMVVGIGINVHPMNLPEELSDIAGSIEDFSKHRGNRNHLIIHFLNRFYYYYSTIEDRTYLAPYRHYSSVIGENILVYERNTCLPAKAIAIDDEARLVIAMEDGTQKVLSSGEISIRKR